MVLIVTDIVKELKSGATISDLLAAQQSYHESRRWSTDELFGGRRATNASQKDRGALYHASRAELTTQPAGIRLAIDGARMANEIREENPLGAAVMHIAAAWSGRYWLEEEAHHEVAYGRLLEMVGIDPIPQDDVMDHRGAFPQDNYARVCMLQACVEVEASTSYWYESRETGDELCHDVFHTIMKDEVQHRQYFAAFSRALVDSGVYPVKDILSTAYVWLRPDGGETFGSARQAQSARDGYINWWEESLTDPGNQFTLTNDYFHEGTIQTHKVNSILALVRECTGIRTESFDDLKRAYFTSLRTNDLDRIRLAVSRGAARQPELV